MSNPGQCPVMHGANTTSQNSNMAWWPNSLKCDSTSRMKKMNPNRSSSCCVMDSWFTFLHCSDFTSFHNLKNTRQVVPR